MTTRRAFLSTSAWISTTLAVHRWSIASDSDKPLSIALLSDTHIAADPENEYRGFKPTANLKRAVEQVVQSPAKIAFLCGDAARANGQRADYEQLQKWLQPIRDKMPMHIALGNHDDRANFQTVFQIAVDRTPLGNKKEVSIVDIGPQRWIVLDSLMYVDKVPGLLGDEQRSWLEKTLASESTKPTILMVHHTLGPRDGDLLDTDRLLAICEKHPQVKAIFFGHSHQWSIERKGNIMWVNLPAVGYNFADTQPVGWVHAELLATEIRLTPHVLGGNAADDKKTTVVSFVQ